MLLATFQLWEFLTIATMTSLATLSKIAYNQFLLLLDMHCNLFTVIEYKIILRQLMLIFSSVLLVLIKCLKICSGGDVTSGVRNLNYIVSLSECKENRIKIYCACSASERSVQSCSVIVLVVYQLHRYPEWEYLIIIFRLVLNWKVNPRPMPAAVKHWTLVVILHTG